MTEKRYPCAWTLDYRPGEKTWPGPYRLRVIFTKRQCEYEVFAQTEDEAHNSMRQILADVQADNTARGQMAGAVYLAESKLQAALVDLAMSGIGDD